MLTVLMVLGSVPALAQGGSGGLPPLGQPAIGQPAIGQQGQQWWLPALHVPQAWKQSEGAGITVAVLGTGVDADHPSLAGSVITGPDYSGSGRVPGSPYWGVEGTAVASVIAGHAPGWGIVGVAPAAKILSVRVTLEFNDPLASDQGISQHLPGAIAEGVRYAVDHGARVVDLPLDPGTLGVADSGDPAAAGGSSAERAAIAYALSRGVVLVAPAGDDGMGPGIVNYPAAYPGVIAVGAVTRDGQLASFSSRRSYTSLTAPGVDLVAALPLDGYGQFSSTSTASGIVAGVAALVLSRFPHLTAPQVTRALVESTVTGAGAASLPPLPARSDTGAGYGTVDAIGALAAAALITSANQAHQRAAVPQPRKPARQTTVPPRRQAASTLPGTVLRAAVAVASGLIVLLVVALLAVRLRRERGPGPAADRPRTRGQHEHRRPDRAAAPAAADQAPAASLAGPARDASREPTVWPSPGGWQGSGLGEISTASEAPSRPVMAPAPAVVPGYRTSRGPAGRNGSYGPPWQPAPEPEWLIGPHPAAPASPPRPEPARGIRVPGDMAPPGETNDPAPADSGLTNAPAAFDLSTPALGFTPPASGVAAPAFGPAAAPGPDLPSTHELRKPDPDQPGLPSRPGLPGKQGLGFAAAPVLADYATTEPVPEAEPIPGGGPIPAAEPVLEAEPVSGAEPVPGTEPIPGAEPVLEAGTGQARAADPGYVWDLAATDVFPVAGLPPQTEETAADRPPGDAPGAGGR